MAALAESLILSVSALMLSEKSQHVQDITQAEAWATQYFKMVKRSLASPPLSTWAEETPGLPGYYHLPQLVCAVGKDIN